MDARLERSRDAIIGAITPMIEQAPAAEISITRLVASAGITRPTFYQQFPDILTAVRVAGLRRLEEAFPLPEPLPAGAELTCEAVRNRVNRQAIPVFEHLARHRMFYVRVMDEAGTAGFFDDLIAFVASRLLPEAIAILAGSPDRIAVTTQFFAGGMTWLAINWLREEAAIPPSEMAREIAGLVAEFLDLSLLRAQQPQ